MKKTYINPNVKVAEIDCASLIANSIQFFSDGDENPATKEGGVSDSDATNGADGLVKGESIWGSGW